MDYLKEGKSYPRKGSSFTAIFSHKTMMIAICCFSICSFSNFSLVSNWYLWTRGTSSDHLWNTSKTATCVWLILVLRNLSKEIQQKLMSRKNVYLIKEILEATVYVKELIHLRCLGLHAASILFGIESVFQSWLEVNRCMFRRCFIRDIILESWVKDGEWISAQQ